MAVAVSVVAGVLLTTSAWRTSTAPSSAPLPVHTFTLNPRTVQAVTPPLIKGAPSHVYVPSLGIAAPWVSAAFSWQHGVAVPADVHTIGLSAQGGQPDANAGTILLAGHVNYAGQGPGAFAAIFRTQPGAVVILTDAAGRSTEWVVTSLTTVLKADLPHSIFTPTGSRRLILATCGGTLHHGNYDHNVVVTAVPLSSAPPKAAAR